MDNNSKVREPSTTIKHARYSRPDQTYNHFQYNFKSEFDRSIDSRNDVISNDNVFPEIPLAKNYGKNCGEIGQVRYIRSLILE